MARNESPDRWLEGDRQLPKDPQHYSQFLTRLATALYEGGWAAIAWPKQYGGRDATLMEEIIYHQEMVRVQSPPLLTTSEFIWLLQP
ncbi:acyl-CoA dehydrogenase family protein [Planococcus faecalis]|uniref:acyl-CoA dehydrogenase family protein n=1 Tax=Planococcus faecalis TaxID=1598147 RepID=UPI000AD7158C|nr:acyl-CoA dehydrogenase family protein [Planococcus faecalis]